MTTQLAKPQDLSLQRLANEQNQETAIEVAGQKTLLRAPEPPQHHFPTAKEKRVEEVNSALGDAYRKAGTLKLTEAEHTELVAVFEDSLVEKRQHDGLWYIPHIHISDRLTRVFGPGQWTMIRRWESIEGNTIYAEWIMIVRGVYVGESVGAADYHPSNKRQNFSDALESTRGEAIRRIAAKYLACGSQVWSPTFKREKPKGPSSVDPKESEVKTLARELWGVLKPIRGTEQNWNAANQWLWREEILDGAHEAAPELSPKRFREVIEKAKERVK